MAGKLPSVSGNPPAVVPAAAVAGMGDMQDWKVALANLLSWTAVAFLARLFIHRGAVARGERVFWSFCLLWEGLVAVLCAILGGGLAEYFYLGGWGTHALVGVCAWIGPKGIDALAQRALALAAGDRGRGES